MLEITGESFTPDLKVWFSDVEAETMYRYISVSCREVAVVNVRTRTVAYCRVDVMWCIHVNVVCPCQRSVSMST